MKNNIGIIGFGRFGKLLAQLLQDEHQVYFYDQHPEAAADPRFMPLVQICQLETLFLAVPIRAIQNVIKNICDTVNPNATIIDVCSVKEYPTQWMLDGLPATTSIIATHPIFGPESYDKMSCVMMMHAARDINNSYTKWYNFFDKLSLTVIEMTPSEHDKAMASTQAITHFIGRGLRHLQASPLATLGFQKLLDVQQQTCADSQALYQDMLRYNPYASSSISTLLDGFKQQYQQIKGDHHGQ